MALIGIMSSVGKALDLNRAIGGLDNSIVTSLHTQQARIYRISRRVAEINRYTKSDDQRIVTEPLPTIRPLIFANYAYEKYRYSKLGSDKSIRLLILQPSGTISPDPASGTDDFISFKLQEVALAANPKYDALSYTWGTLPRDFPVLIMPHMMGGEITAKMLALFISPSLYAALKRLRHPTDERVLWIDQLCINQEDNDEKSKQVMLMAEIYEKAEKTVVWLGEEDEDNKVLSELVDLFESHPSRTRKDDIDLMKTKLDLLDTHPIDLDAVERGRWRHQALVRLLNRSWFSRAWIFQEAVKSSQVLLLCGSLTMLLETLLRLSHAVFEIEEESKGYAYSLTKSTTGFDTLYLIEHTRPGGCSDSECERRNLQPGFLGLLMQALQQFEATVPHDLIYAFLAFRENVIIVPNYNAPVSVAWKEAAKSIIKATNSLDIFSAVRGDQPCVEPIPSWVPDWSQCFPYARPICAPDFKSDFKACNALLDPESRSHRELGPECPHIWEDPPETDPHSLIVRGKIIGFISWLSPPNFESNYYRDGLKSVFGLDQHIIYLKKELNFQPPFKAQHLRETTKEVLIRTILADGAFGHHQPMADSPNEIIQICEEEEEIEAARRKAGPEGLSPEVIDKKEALDRCRQWSLIVQQKKIFLCQGQEDGELDLGLAPKAVQNGDLVCVLYGSKVPCVLRRLDNETGRYRVIGQCYLDRWMYGTPPAGRNWVTGEEDEFVLV